MPFLTPFLGEGSTEIDHRKMGTLIPTSLLEDLEAVQFDTQWEGSFPTKHKLVLIWFVRGCALLSALRLELYVPGTFNSRASHSHKGRLWAQGLATFALGKGSLYFWR